MEFVLIWVIFSPLVAVYARRNGRSGVLAFLLAIILSPLLAFLIYALRGESRKAKTRRLVDEERIRAEARKSLSD